MEEQVKGAAPEPAAGAYVAEKKKSFFGFTTKRGRLTRRRSGIKKGPLGGDDGYDSTSRTTLAPDQQARIQQAAADLAKKKQAEQDAETKTNSRERERSSLESEQRIHTWATDQRRYVTCTSVGTTVRQERDSSQISRRQPCWGKGPQELLTLPSNGINRSASSVSSMGRDNKELPAPPKDTSRQHLPIENHIRTYTCST